jgi:TolB-like protein
MLPVIVFAFITVIAANPGGGHSGRANPDEKKARLRIVVIPTGTSETDWSRTMTAAALEDALSQNRRFDLITASQREKLLREQGFSNSDMVDPKQAIEVGKLLSARYIVIGNVLDISINRLIADTVNVRVQLQIVEAETGLVKLSKSFDETVTKFGKSETIHKREAFQSVMKKISPLFVRELERTIPIEGLVAKLYKMRVYLNVGSEQGLQPGQIFDIYTEGEPIKDASGETLSYIKVIRARLRVIEVESSVAWGVVTDTFTDDGARDPKPVFEKIKVGYAVKRSDLPAQGPAGRKRQPL